MKLADPRRRRRHRGHRRARARASRPPAPGSRSTSTRQRRRAARGRRGHRPVRQRLAPPVRPRPRASGETARRGVSTPPTELIYRDGRSAASASPPTPAAPPTASASARPTGACTAWSCSRPSPKAFTAAAGEDHLHLGRSRHRRRTPSGRALRPRRRFHRQAVGDVVVGADGVHSDGPRPRHRSGVSGPVYSGHQRVPRSRPASPTCRALPDPHAIQFWTGPGRPPAALRDGLGRARRRHGQLLRRAVRAREEWEGGNRREVRDGELLDGLRRLAPGGARDARRGASRARAGPCCHQPALTRWTRGRVALIGDACHAMLPHHGQGANQSIEDAMTLVGLARPSTTGGRAVSRRPRPSTPDGGEAGPAPSRRSAWDTGTLLHLD